MEEESPLLPRAEDSVNAPEVSAKQQHSGRRFPFAVLVLSAGLVFFASGQAVAFKRLGYELGPYPYFILLTVSFAFIPLFYMLILYIRWYAGGFSGEQTSNRFKLYYCVIGAMNALNGVLIIFANPHVPGVMQQILAQVVVPVTVLMSIVFLKCRFRSLQYAGAFVVVVGIVIGLIPTFRSFGGSSTGGVFWNIMFLLGQLPVAAASVYQEHQFSKAKVNIVLMMFWAAVSQFVVLVLCAPLNFIPHFGGLRPSEFIDNLRDAALCTANSLHTAESSCRGAWELLLIAIITMLLTNVFQTALVKYGSASLCVIVQTLVTPVSAIAFTFRFLLKKHTESMSSYAWGSLAVLMSGIIIYRFVDLQVLRLREKRLLKQSRSDASLEGLEQGTGAEPEEHPLLLSSRMGMIQSEYTNASHDPRSIIFEHTKRFQGRSSGDGVRLSSSAPV